MIAAAAPAFPHLRDRVATPPGQHCTPPRRPAMTRNNAIQVTIYNCRIRTAFGKEGGYIPLKALVVVGAHTAADLCL